MSQPLLQWVIVLGFGRERPWAITGPKIGPNGKVDDATA